MVGLATPELRLVNLILCQRFGVLNEVSEQILPRLGSLPNLRVNLSCAYEQDQCDQKENHGNDP